MAYWYFSYPVEYKSLLFLGTLDLVQKIKVVEVEAPEQGSSIGEPGVLAIKFLGEEFEYGVPEIVLVW